MITTERGKEGEDLACQYLESEGHEVVCRNFRNRLGEIDIISKKHDFIFFIEVKYWETNLITPLEVFTKKKIGIMRKLAEYFFYSNPNYSKNFFVSFCLLDIKKDRIQFHRDLF
ncbi:MAG: YraN family protein [Leptospiraceae bacterium]|nr:YraN family protein [Leptospiraceae bacterium]